MTRPRFGHRLTRRESLIYDLILAGRKNREIEVQLGITHSTLKTHVNHIYKKLGERMNRTSPEIMTDQMAASEYAKHVLSEVARHYTELAFLAGCAKVRDELKLKIEGGNK